MSFRQLIFSFVLIGCFETLGIHDINKIDIKIKNSKEFPVLGPSCSMSWHNVLPINNHHYLFCVVHIIDLLLCYDKTSWKFCEEIILVITVKNKKNPKGSPILAVGAPWADTMLYSPVLLWFMQINYLSCVMIYFVLNIMNLWY